MRITSVTVYKIRIAIWGGRGLVLVLPSKVAFLCLRGGGGGIWVRTMFRKICREYVHASKK